MTDYFDHKEAQSFELKWQKGYIKENFEKEYQELSDRKKEILHGYYYKHFISDNDLSDKFLNHAIDKKVIELGCGSFPQLKEAWNIPDRIVIDPLADEYHNFQMDLFNVSFFDGLKIYSKNAEIVIPELLNSVDGFILCRNMLDHSENPYAILETISKYAIKGCYLCLWSDIWHYDGGNVGHKCITKDGNIIINFLDNLGFEFVDKTPKVRSGETENYFIEFGGVFIKK